MTVAWYQRGERLTVPELVDLEVTSVLRRQMKAGTLDARRARLALDDLAALPARRAPVRGWEGSGPGLTPGTTTTPARASNAPSWAFSLFSVCWRSAC